MVKNLILPTQEAQIRRIVFQSQSRQILLKSLSQKKNPITKEELVEWLKV
jgi:hypothetical protein